ncbi:hypothetical protein D9V41_08645 [Aeromicrobium phragmitis]|uniref:DUF2188 domain-containing protein n=1 Tax=Aeromicrobium phragmitis TaxID=2478914 RepID=A0A3L8PKS5_9ACTN|nr:hypothetical protein [Aeromicrobium phragmitis]RLV55957.1 hypothetical protein D9V41_08645 [Aeromicrobium phragmitis]
MTAAWRWTYETADGEQVGNSHDFDSRSDAETFIGLEFETLLGNGVDQVRLHEGDTEVYGPMSLHAE